MPKFTVSIAMDIVADDEVHAAALGYRALRDNPPPLYYAVTGADGQSKDIVVDREAAEAFTENDDFVKIADGLLGFFNPKK
jgi:hypothetical protein